MKSTSHRIRALALIVCCWGIVLGTIQSAQATITVTNLNDSGPGSLRQAIADTAPGDTIDFAVTGTITLTSGELMITNDLTISGPGPTNLTVSGNYASRVLHVTNGVVNITGLKIAHGGGPNGGAGILNLSVLSVSNCVISGCTAEPTPDGSGWPHGGGVASYGLALTLTDCIISENAAIDGTAIFHSRDGALEVRNSLIVSNRQIGFMTGGHAVTVWGGSAMLANSTICLNSTKSFGGAVHALASGPRSFTITSCTIVSNLYSGGGLSADPPVVNLPILRNSILAGNGIGGSGPDCWGAINSLDYNLIQNTNGCTITNLTAHNIYSQDPKLGPLADYGGPTPTMVLLAGSPAIDAGGTSDCLQTDQRGRPRPNGGACDIGAVESCPPYVIIGTVSGSTLVDEVTILPSQGSMVSTVQGAYIVDGLTPGAYTITASNSFYHIVPSNCVVTVGPDQKADFTAYRWNALSMEGTSNGMLHLIYAGTNGETVRTLASSNLADWTAIATNTVPSTNLFDIFDTTSQPQRFYRTVKP